MMRGGTWLCVRERCGEHLSCLSRLGLLTHPVQPWDTLCGAICLAANPTSTAVNTPPLLVAQGKEV
jgi:hypothetical protein